MTTRIRSATRLLAAFVALIVAVILCFVHHGNLEAQARVGRSYARTSVHRSSSVAVNRHVDVDVHRHGRWGHPVAATVAATATAVAIGTVVASLPRECSALVVGSATYQNCGGVYYQPVYHGSTVQYVVVNQP